VFKSYLLNKSNTHIQPTGCIIIIIIIIVVTLFVQWNACSKHEKRVKAHWTRKHRQSYRHAYQGRVHLIPRDLDLWPSDLRVNIRRATAIEYMRTTFGVDRWSHFSFRARTNKQTNRHADATERRTLAGGYTAGVGNKTYQAHKRLR